ncbi:MAG: hypothetical protein K8F24_02690, partial [Bacteroidales bacterium]|nr:hypothetical protein [Bacteroidales bacterium]
FKEANTEKILVPYLAQTYWSQSNIEALDVVEQNSNVILLFGSEEAVKSFKKDVAPKCEVLACGPKVSFGIVTADQAEDELATAAKGFAADVVFWEQRACTACQNIFVEKSENSDLFIKMLFSGLEKTVQSTVNDGFTLQLVLDPSCIYNRLKLQVETQKLKDDALLQLLKEIRYEKVPVFKQSKEESMISLFEISFADPVFAASHSEAWESKKDC